MGVDFNIEQCERLREIVSQADLHHSHPPSRYDPGHVFELGIRGVCPAVEGKAKLEVERFVGGGFAGQVYRVKLAELDLDDGEIPGLEAGNSYALKIIIPPSAFSLMFRNTVYWMAYQGSFSAQVNEAAARTGVLWQKLIRQGAKARFGDERAVADTYATFFEPGLGSFGEINEWIDGRNWNFEVDEQVFSRRKRDPETAEHSAEFLAKKKFMRDIVVMFHDMGAPELARQYEWWSCKSQPNVLKRRDSENGASDGLCALDFRAGLAVLPFLPMSPVDFCLIVKGLMRGDLVQFDRGNLEKLEEFCSGHDEEFKGVLPAIEELKEVDPKYRASLPDISHHGFSLLYKRQLRNDVRAGIVQGWKVRGFADEACSEKLNRSWIRFFLFFAAGLLPILGGYIRRFSGLASFRRHVRAFFTSFDYTKRTWRAKQAEYLIDWHRYGRVGEDHIEFYLGHPTLFWFTRIIPGILPMPPKWHRFLTDWKFAKTTVKNTVTYPIRFYRDAQFREEWLISEIEAGAKEGMLTQEEHDLILSQVKDPFIQKYLKCVAVHICTLPATQIVSLLVALWGFFYLGKTWEESTAWFVAILVTFQVMPISPGSIIRGSYVVYLIIKERNLRNYWLAAIVSFWKYIGYLGFPLQMVKEFPVLSRFMAGRWSTKMVGFIPVFGERGALPEHFVFDLFFNVPLSIKRKFKRGK